MALSPWFIAFFIIASLSITGNTLSILRLLSEGTLSAVTTRLILYLHVSSLLENIGSLPIIYTGNEALCQTMAVVHYYGGLANVLSITLLTIIYLNFTLEESHRSWAIQNFGGYIAFSLPLITLLPFSTDAYGVTGVWCSLDLEKESTDVWAFIIFYIWALIAIIFCAIVFVYILNYSRRFDDRMGRTLFLTSGIYILISWCSLVPRCIPRFINLFERVYLTRSEQFFSNIPAFLAGIGYSICLFYNFRLFSKYEKHSSKSMSQQSLSISIADLEAALSAVHHESSSQSVFSFRSSGPRLSHLRSASQQRNSFRLDSKSESSENSNNLMNSNHNSNNNSFANNNTNNKNMNTKLSKISEDTEGVESPQPSAGEDSTTRRSSVRVGSSLFSTTNPILDVRRSSVMEVNRKSSLDENTIL
jgi:hypothetical protein